MVKVQFFYNETGIFGQILYGIYLALIYTLASYGWAYVSSFTPIPTIGPSLVLTIILDRSSKDIPFEILPLVNIFAKNSLSVLKGLLSEFID